jgi:hypothetical protein
VQPFGLSEVSTYLRPLRPLRPLDSSTGSNKGDRRVSPKAYHHPCPFAGARGEGGKKERKQQSRPNCFGARISEAFGITPLLAVSQSHHHKQWAVLGPEGRQDVGQGSDQDQIDQHLNPAGGRPIHYNCLQIEIHSANLPRQFQGGNQTQPSMPLDSGAATGL